MHMYMHVHAILHILVFDLLLPYMYYLLASTIKVLFTFFKHTLRPHAHTDLLEAPTVPYH